MNGDVDIRGPERMRDDLHERRGDAAVLRRVLRMVGRWKEREPGGVADDAISANRGDRTPEPICVLGVKARDTGVGGDDVPHRKQPGSVDEIHVVLDRDIAQSLVRLIDRVEVPEGRDCFLLRRPDCAV